ncbi:MAG: transglutaminase family protein [Thermoanaerobaculia bacterium]|nr:transglutaminase family protein [Thermoanaerobaculia bacterium]
MTVEAEASANVTLEVVHSTRYRYQAAVTHSRHNFRLRPLTDRQQELLHFDLEVWPQGERRDFDDVFGNAVTRVEIESPYDEMTIKSRSVVCLRPETRVPPPRNRATIPVAWMPWDREMMQPYLLPPELPEGELQELFDYAMSFVALREHDLAETLEALNLAISQDWEYTPGHTTLETTPYEVFTSRRGVCQDFANLLICLARLLGVPARYRTGYIYTGASYENKMQSEASHAWAELYLPRHGWVGYDPTNGVQSHQDHVRVACGRNYRDTSPTTGTIFRGGGGEILDFDVEVSRL